MWRWRKKKTRRLRGSTVTKHYLENKETARKLVLARLQYFSQHYGLEWKRVAIRNQRRCWGSCSSLKNLNFNYKIQFLPPHLRDYIIVHEMCHLTHLNHQLDFWNLVGEVIPDYARCVAELQAIDKSGHSIENLLKIQAGYLSGTIKRAKPASEMDTNFPLSCEACGSSVICICSNGIS